MPSHIHPLPLRISSLEAETHRMKLYIAGPMTGLPEYNYPAFHSAEATLKAHGYDVGNPARTGQQPGWEWADYMRAALRIMLDCDAVALLPGWTESRGALIEASLAERLGMPARHLAHWGPR